MALPRLHLVPGLPRLTSFLRRLGVASEGVETIEFALSAIPLLLFLLGVVEFARLYWVQSELQYAAEAAARCVTTNCCSAGPSSCGGSTGNTGVQSFAANQVLGMTVQSTDLQSFTVGTASCGNQVSFSYTFHFLVGDLIPNSNISLSTSACNQA